VLYIKVFKCVISVSSAQIHGHDTADMLPVLALFQCINLQRLKGLQACPVMYSKTGVHARCKVSVNAVNPTYIGSQRF
jgi:hypothetical protein